MAAWCLTFIVKLLLFHLSAQPNCRITTLTQAFIIHSPINDLLSLLFELVAAGRVEFVRHHEYPSRWKAGCLADPLGSLQQRPKYVDHPDDDINRKSEYKDEELTAEELALVNTVKDQLDTREMIPSVISSKEIGL